MSRATTKTPLNVDIVATKRTSVPLSSPMVPASATRVIAHHIASKRSNVSVGSSGGGITTFASAAHVSTSRNERAKRPTKRATGLHERKRSTW